MWISIFLLALHECSTVDSLDLLMDTYLSIVSLGLLWVKLLRIVLNKHFYGPLCLFMRCWGQGHLSIFLTLQMPTVMLNRQSLPFPSSTQTCDSKITQRQKKSCVAPVPRDNKSTDAKGFDFSPWFYKKCPDLFLEWTDILDAQFTELGMRLYSLIYFYPVYWTWWSYNIA